MTRPDEAMVETLWPGASSPRDVRAAATNRVAGAVGDGALALRFAHQVPQASALRPSAAARQLAYRRGLGEQLGALGAAEPLPTEGVNLVAECPSAWLHGAGASDVEMGEDRVVV